MSLYTITPTPISGGSVANAHTEGNWTVTQLSTNRFVLCYQQTTPGAWIAQVIETNSTSGPPTVGTSYQMFSPSGVWRARAFAVSPTRFAFVYVKGTSGDIFGRIFDVDGSNVITSTSGEQALFTGTVASSSFSHTTVQGYAFESTGNRLNLHWPFSSDERRRYGRLEVTTTINNLSGTNGETERDGGSNYANSTLVQVPGTETYWHGFGVSPMVVTPNISVSSSGSLAGTTVVPDTANSQYPFLAVFSTTRGIASNSDLTNATHVPVSSVSAENPFVSSTNITSVGSPSGSRNAGATYMLDANYWIQVQRINSTPGEIRVRVCRKLRDDYYETSTSTTASAGIMLASSSTVLNPVIYRINANEYIVWYSIPTPSRIAYAVLRNV